MKRGVGKCVGVWGESEEKWGCVEKCRGGVGKSVGVWGEEVWRSVLGCGGSEKSCGKCVGVRGKVWRRGRCGKMWGRCEKVCWGVGRVKRGVGTGVRVWKEVRGEVYGVSVKSVEKGVGKCVGVWGEVKSGVSG